MTQTERSLRIAILEKKLQDAEQALYHSRTILRTILDESGEIGFAEPSSQPGQDPAPAETYIQAAEEGCLE